MKACRLWSRLEGKLSRKKERSMPLLSEGILPSMSVTYRAGWSQYLKARIYVLVCIMTLDAYVLTVRHTRNHGLVTRCPSGGFTGSGEKANSLTRLQISHSNVFLCSFLAFFLTRLPSTHPAGRVLR